MTPRLAGTHCLIGHLRTAPPGEDIQDPVLHYLNDTYEDHGQILIPKAPPGWDTLITRSYEDSAAFSLSHYCIGSSKNPWALFR
jgi:hypothetical protein